MRRVLRRIFVYLALGLVAASVAFLWGKREFERPGPLAAETTIILPQGTGLEAIARQLAEAGVLDRPWLFVLAARFSDAARDLRAGEFAFPAGISAIGAMELLLSGRTVVRRLTVPEGVTTSQVLDLVAASEGLVGEVGLVPGEGTLLPETYYFSYGDSRSDMVARMAAAMTSALTELWDAATRGDGAVAEWSYRVAASNGSRGCHDKPGARPCRRFRRSCRRSRTCPRRGHAVARNVLFLLWR